MSKMELKDLMHKSGAIMNPQPHAIFEAQVKRIVAPLFAGPWRKEIMRRDLLAHLLAAAEEESGAAGALHRMGDEIALRRELQSTVPLLERWIFGILYSKEFSMKRLFWLVAIFAVFFGPAIVLPALAKLKHEGTPPPDRMFFMVLGILITLAGLAGVGFGVIRQIKPAR